MANKVNSRSVYDEIMGNTGSSGSASNSEAKSNSSGTKKTTTTSKKVNSRSVYDEIMGSTAKTSVLPSVADTLKKDNTPPVSGSVFDQAAAMVGANDDERARKLNHPLNDPEGVFLTRFANAYNNPSTRTQAETSADSVRRRDIGSDLDEHTGRTGKSGHEGMSEVMEKARSVRQADEDAYEMAKLGILDDPNLRPGNTDTKPYVKNALSERVEGELNGFIASQNHYLRQLDNIDNDLLKSARLYGVGDPQYNAKNYMISDEEARAGRKQWYRDAMAAADAGEIPEDDRETVLAAIREYQRFGYFLDMNADMIESDGFKARRDWTTENTGANPFEYWLQTGKHMYSFNTSKDSAYSKAYGWDGGGLSTDYNELQAEQQAWALGWASMTDDEINLYFYLKSTKGDAVAGAWLNNMSPTLIARFNDDLDRAAGKITDEMNPALKLVATPIYAAENVGARAMQTGAYAYGAATGNNDDPRYMMSLHSSAPAFEQGVAKSFGDGTKNLFKKFGFSDSIADGAATVAQNSYSAIMSGVESIIGTLTMGHAYTGAMGGGAATEEAINLYRQGASMDQVRGGAFMTGLFEAMFEYVSIEVGMNFLKGQFSSLRQFWASLGLSSLAEASEEVFTSIADRKFDDYNRGDASEHNRRVRAYKESGLSAEDAENRAEKDFRIQLLWDAYGGALASLGMMGGTGKMALNQVTRFTEGRTINATARNAEVQDTFMRSLPENVRAEIDANPNYETDNLIQRMAADYKVGRQMEKANAKESRETVAALETEANESYTQNKPKGVSRSGFRDMVISAYYNGTEGLTNKQKRIYESSGAAAVVESVKSKKADATYGRFYAGHESEFIRDALEIDPENETARAAMAAIENGETVSGRELRQIENDIAARLNRTYRTDASGRATIQTEEGAKSVTVKDVASVENGTMMLNLEDGSTVDAKDVRFGSSAEAMLHSVVAEMAVSTENANSMINAARNSDIGIEAYALGIQEAYRYGKIGVNAEQMSKDGFAADLSITDRMTAYTLGRNAAEAEASARQASNETRTATKRKAGKIVYEGVNLNGRKLNNQQKAGLQMARFLAASGLNVHVYESTFKDGKWQNQFGSANGAYIAENGDIYLDLAAGANGQGAIAYTVSHEFTHFIRDWSPVKFKEFADALFEELGKSDADVNSMIAREYLRAKQNPAYKNKTDAQLHDIAYEEVVANACETMLTDTDAAARLAANIKAKDESLWSRIKKFFNRLVEHLRGAYKDANLAPDSAIANEARETIQKVETLAQIWADAGANAIENFNRAAQRTAEQNAVKASDDSVNAEVRASETATAEGMTNASLKAVQDTSGDGVFQLRTMKNDLDAYMQDLVDAGIVGEGKPMSKNDLDYLYRSINRVMDYVEAHITEIERNEEFRNMDAEHRPFLPYKDNSDPHYKMALDYSTLCRKRLLTQAITERLQGALKRALTPVEQVRIRNEIKKLQAEGKKIDVACALCYVEAARLKSPKVINEFLNNKRAELLNYFSLKNKRFKNEVYNVRQGDWKEAHGLSRTATKDDIKAAGLSVAEFNAFCKDIRKGYFKWAEQYDRKTFDAQTETIRLAESMDNKQFLSAATLARLRNSNPDLYDAFIFKVRSATRSKAQETDVPYARGDINQVGNAIIEQMNNESGFRHQSWSDFQAMHLLDTVASIIELSTKQAKVHTYTKVADMVRFLGNTNMAINMSLIPMGNTGLDANGELIFDPVEGIAYETMKELRDQYHSTAGNIAIGISDEQIRALLRSEFIDYVIPYHTSGLNADMRKRMGIKAWQDYSKTQNEKGDAEAPTLREWFNEQEAMAAVDGTRYMVDASRKYLELCAQRNLTPKFPQFLKHNSDGSYSLKDDALNYWKLLIDRKMVDQVTNSVIIQKPVTPTFDVDTMMDILSSEVNSQAAKDAREAEDFIVNKMLNDTTAFTKAELAEARRLRDAAVMMAVENSDAMLSDRDSEGNTLTKEQQEYFKDSTARDDDGNLRVVYHGTEADFTVFDPKKARTNMDIQGMFFSPYDIDAGGYGSKLGAYYLNIKNPADESKAYSALRKFQGQNGAGVMARRYLIHQGYDGVYNGYDEYIAFYPEQIKRIDNKKPTENVDVRFSFRQYTDHERENWKSSKRIVLYENDSQYRSFINESLANGQYNKKIYFGAISDELADLIYKYTGISVHGFNCSISSYEIRKITKDHGNAEKEALRGQRPITEEDFIAIPKVILNPSNIIKSDKLYNGKPAIIFRGAQYKNISVVSVVSDGHMDLFVQTAYASAKKGNLSMPIGDQAPINTPEANNGTVSDKTISQEASESQAENWLLSERESDILETESRISELEDRIEFAEIDGLSLKERNELVSELWKKKEQLSRLVSEERSSAKKTSPGDILDNLERYRLIDLRSLAEQMFEETADLESREDYIDAIRGYLEEIQGDLDEDEFYDKRNGWFVKPVNNLRLMYSERNAVTESDNGDAVLYSERVDGKMTHKLADGRTVDTLEYLNNLSDDEVYHTFKSMSFWGYDENGNAILRSPMAERDLSGKMTGAYLLPSDGSKIWYYATENAVPEGMKYPEGLLVKYRKPGNKSDSYIAANKRPDLVADDWSNLYFLLERRNVETNEKETIYARYNPYEHSSDVMLNDQFKGAYKRPNLVTVEMAVPKSEDNGVYRADYSKDPTGWVEWKSGDVATKIGQQKNFERSVFLSRFAAPVRIVPDAEVAQAYKQYLEGTDVAVPDNVVSPSLLSELRKAGVPIKVSGKIKAQNNTDAALLSERDGGMGNRFLLANTLESAVKDDAEGRLLERYKDKIEDVSEQQIKLGDLRKQLKELSFAKGKRDQAAIKNLRDEITKTENRINIIDRQLLRLEATEPLKNLLKRERNQAMKEAREEGRERLQQYRNDRKTTEIRNKVKRYVEDFRKMLLNPTDRQYIPAALVESVIDIYDMIDPTGKNQNSKAAKKYRDAKEALMNLKNTYDQLQEMDYDFSSEFNADFSMEIARLAQAVGNTPLRSMNLAQLTDVYNVIHDISAMIKDARRQIGRADAISNYQAGQQIIEEMGNVKKLNISQDMLNSFLREWTLNPIRATREMSAFNDSAMLWQLINEINAGRRKADKFTMDINKRFEALRADKNGEQTYNDAVENASIQVEDTEGRKVNISKMQAMQAILTWEREAGNENRKHLQTPVHFTDVSEDVKGRYSRAFDLGHDVIVNQDLVQMLTEQMTEWDQKYLAEARKFFRVDSTKAINETTMLTKHRAIATERNYIPYYVNQDYISKESENVKFDGSIEGMGMLKSVKNNAPQQIVIRGLNTVIADHLAKVSKVYGLAIPVRNWNKAFNMHQKNEDGGRTVKTAIRDAWHDGGLKMLDQAVADVQSGRKTDGIPVLNNIKAAFVTSTLASNLSVWMKQAASYPTAGAILKTSSLLKALPQFATKTSRLFDEIDQHTSQHYIRRQGLSTQELGDMNQTHGWQQKLNRKLGALSPMNWIQAMDVHTTAVLWQACKYDVESDGVSRSSEEYWKKVTDLYDRVIEDTQPMYDPLHRAEVTKSGALKSFIMFQTQPIQNSGILREGAMKYKMAKRQYGAKSSQTKQAMRSYRMAVGSQLASHFVFTAMTLVSAAMLHKMNPWKDDKDKKVTAESVAKTFLQKFVENVFGALVPVFGSYIVSMIQKFAGTSSYDVLSDPTVDKINTTIDTFTAINWPTIQKLIGLMDDPEGNAEEIDEIVSGMWSDAGNIAADVASYFGIPAGNILNIVNGFRLHTEDAMNGQLGSFEAGTTRTSAQKSSLLYEAYVSGDEKDMARARAQYKDQKAVDSALRTALRENDPRIREAAEAQMAGNNEERVRIAREIIGEGHFSQDIVVAAINNEISSLTKKPDQEYKPKAQSVYSTDDYVDAAIRGRSTYEIEQEIISAGISNGKTEKEAKTSMTSSVRTEIKDRYRDGTITETEAVTGLMGSGMSSADAEKRVQYWDFQAEHPDIKWSEEAVDKYVNDIAPTGISVEVYDDYRNMYTQCIGTDLDGDGKTDSGSKKAQIVAVIDSLPLTREQKDVLYRSNGWAIRGLAQTPWH